MNLTLVLWFFMMASFPILAENHRDSGKTSSPSRERGGDEWQEYRQEAKAACEKDLPKTFSSLRVYVDRPELFTDPEFEGSVIQLKVKTKDGEIKPQSIPNFLARGEGRMKALFPLANQTETRNGKPSVPYEAKLELSWTSEATGNMPVNAVIPLSDGFQDHGKEGLCLKLPDLQKLPIELEGPEGGRVLLAVVNYELDGNPVQLSFLPSELPKAEGENTWSTALLVPGDKKTDVKVQWQYLEKGEKKSKRKTTKHEVDPVKEMNRLSVTK